MIGAFLYLTLCTARNRVLARIRRLKNPRYAIGLVVGIAYLYLLVFRRSHRLAGAPDMAARFADLRGPFEVLGRRDAARGRRVRVAVAGDDAGGADLHARRRPVPLLPLRSAAVSWSATQSLKSQLAALAGSAFFTLIFRHNSLAGGWSFFIGVALLMNVLNLHFTGVSLGRESLARHGRSGWTRQWLPLAVVAAALAVLVVTVARSWPELAGFSSGHELLATIQRIGTHGPLGVVLWPFRALVRLPLAETLSGFARALPTVLADPRAQRRVGDELGRALRGGGGGAGREDGACARPPARAGTLSGRDAVPPVAHRSRRDRDRVEEPGAARTLRLAADAAPPGAAPDRHRHHGHPAPAIAPASRR